MNKEIAGQERSGSRSSTRPTTCRPKLKRYSLPASELRRHLHLARAGPFSLKGAGIIQIGADLKTTRMVATPADMKKTNLHNTTIWNAPDGVPHLLFPDNEGGHVYITTLDGKLDYALNTPEAGTNIGHPVANDCFEESNAFPPTSSSSMACYT